MPINPSDEDADFKMMTSPDEWPLWPILPLKRPGKGEVAVLINNSLNDDHDLQIAVGKTMFDKITSKDVRRVNLDGIRQLVNDGWQVD